MSRPSRYAGKQTSQVQPMETNGQNHPGPITAAALSKARIQFNEPLAQLQAIFPEWKEDDLLSLLEEVKGDVETAVARISEGHAEQWGSVKHKKDKKPPHRERERDRDSHSTRGQSNSRGRGRGGRSAGPSRHPKEKSSINPPSKPEQAFNTFDEGPSTTSSLPDKVDSTQNVTGPDDKLAFDSVVISTIHYTPEPPNPSSTPRNHPRETQAPTSNTIKKSPASSGMSWAQIAKPQPKDVAAPKVQGIPSDTEPQSSQSQVTAPEIQREQPTTVENPSWEDEPSPSNPPTVEPYSENGWVDPIPHVEKKVDEPSTEQSSPDELQVETNEPSLSPALQNQSIPRVNDSEVPTPPGASQSSTIAPSVNAPPGLAAPPNLQTTELLKPVIPIATRNTATTHRIGYRFKGDQAVIMPPHQQSIAAHIIGAKPLPLQFGSLNIAGDDSDTLPVSTPLDAIQQETLSSGVNAQVDAPIPTNTTTLANKYEDPTPEQRSQLPVDSRDLNGAVDSPVHTQTASLNQALAIAPHGQHLVSQAAIASQHSLAGLTHVPQLPNHPAPLNHPQAQHLNQQGQLAQQQQQYDGPSVGAGGLSSNIGQIPLSQTQNQPFLRHSESPFYTSQNMLHSQDQGFGVNNTGAFAQGIQSAFNGGQTLTDFNYDGQRLILRKSNPYDNHNPQSSFSGRAMLRQDEVKGGIASPAQGLHQSHNTSTLGTTQANGVQGQGQYPNMTHLTNPFYYNMNPYSYGNQFYSPAFTSFVNPMYAGSGHHTPPHGSKPASNMSGASGAASYGANNPGHFHHSSGGFDNDGVPNGPTQYQTPSGLTNDFSKSSYSSGQSFLGGIGNSSSTRGSGPSASTPESFKAYGSGANIQSGMISTDKGTPASQQGRVQGIMQGGQQPQQPFYHGSRFQNTASNNPGFQHGQPQQQSDTYYSGYPQRW
ncbi:hypothetical protein FRC17_004220 [Serendipita sp. 399]|nr:hypothetical protein FRC17_004220 [Serendipita sp. 399]